MTADAPPASPPPPVHAPLEALGLVALGLAVACGAAFLPPAAGQVVPLLVFLGWVGPAYALATRRGRDPLVEHGVLVRPGRLAPAAALSLLVLALYVPAFWLVAGRPAARPIPWGDAGAELLWGLLFVALPEEYAFRGVLQPALDAPAGPRRTLLGAPFGRGAVVSALLFGLAHVAADLDPRRAVVVFPGLWFAWLRARTGSVLPGAVAHATANALQRACFAAWGAPG